MNICFISNLFPRADSPRRGMFNLRLVRALAKTCKVSVFVPAMGMRNKACGRPEETSSYDVTPVPVFHLPLIGRNLAAGFHLKALDTVREKLKDADVILASWLYPDGAAAARIGAELNKPVWIQVLGSDVFHLANNSRRKQILKACSESAGVICVAPHLKQRLIEAGAKGNKISVVTNGVDTDLFNYNPAVEIQDKVIWAGNLVPVKGPDRMLDVWERVQEARSMEHGELSLVMVGDGPMRKSLECRARSMGLEDTVSFLGSLSEEEVARQMRQARLLCLTSHSEGMPNVVLEALASGLPVVAPDVGAVPSMLEGCGECAVVPEGEGFEGRFAAGVKHVASLDVDRETLSSKHSKRTWNVVAQEMLNLMR